uniref:Uncharacterized protein n=1 Tax=Peronospora matthiolae TaxID=2874970 RepID=A0AAV1TIJ4_9STRA
MRTSDEGDSLTSAAGDPSPAVAIQQQAVSVVNSPRGESPRAKDRSAAVAAGTANRNVFDSEIELIDSSESDDVSDSKAAPHASRSSGADIARARLTGSGQRGGTILEIFGSSDCSDESLSYATQPNDRTRGNGGDALMHHHERSNSRDRGVTVVIDHAGNQEARNRNFLRHAPQVESPWMTASKELDRLASMTTNRDRIPFFDCRKICPPDSSTETFRAEEESSPMRFYTSVVQWECGRDGKALMLGWNAFIHNIKCISREACLGKFDAARIRYKKRNPAGMRYKLHRLSVEAGLPCISWGDSCPGCLDNSNRAPRETSLPNVLYWRARISSEMAEKIDTLQSLYARSGRSISDGPFSNAAGGSRRTARRDPGHQQSSGHEAPSCPTPVDSHASGRGNSSGHHSRRGGSKSAPLESVDHRLSPP